MLVIVVSHHGNYHQWYQKAQIYPIRPLYWPHGRLSGPKVLRSIARATQLTTAPSVVDRPHYEFLAIPRSRN